MKLSRVILLALLVFFIGQIAYFYPQLPETVATHFGLNGEADGWSSKQGWLIFQIILLFGISILTFGLTTFIEKTDDQFINLPNKNYWLATERRSETFAYFRQQFEWLGVALFVLLNIITLDTVTATLGRNQTLSNFFFFYFFGFIGFILIWTFAFCRRFNKI
jgi:uncharacterized membrane protein